MSRIGSQFEQQIIDLAHLYGWSVAAFRSVQIQRKGGATYWATPVKADGTGWPDLVLVRGSRIIFRELKAGKHARLSGEQRLWRDRLRAAHQDWKEWRPEQLDQIIEELRA